VGYLGIATLPRVSTVHSINVNVLVASGPESSTCLYRAVDDTRGDPISRLEAKFEVRELIVLSGRRGW